MSVKYIENKFKVREDYKSYTWMAKSIHETWPMIKACKTLTLSYAYEVKRMDKGSIIILETRRYPEDGRSNRVIENRIQNAWTQATATENLEDGDSKIAIKKVIFNLNLRENSTSGFGGTKGTKNDWYTFSSSLATATVPYRENSVCEQKAFDYVYRENLCHALDPDTYMIAAKARYTCENRCGNVPEHRKDLYSCACDEVCIPYKDCCRDFSVVCPSLYARGHSIYYDFARKVRPLCSAKDFKVLVKTAYDSHTTESPKQRAIKTETANNLRNNSNNFMWLRNTGVETFTLGDHSSKILFLDFATHKLSRQLTSNSFFIPKLFSLNCPKVSFSPLMSLQETLHTCEKIATEEVDTPLHRNCKINQIVSCPCHNSVYYRQHLHNICMGHNRFISALNQQPLKNFQINFPGGAESTRCSVHNFTESLGLQVSSIRQLSGKRSTVRIRITPFQTSLSVLGQSNNHKKNDSHNNASKENEETKPRGFIDKDDIYYILEFENTLERRLRCSTIDSFPADCQLEECSQGAIVASTTKLGTSTGVFGNSSCILPVVAKVQGNKVPVTPCSCLRAMAALSSLQIWIVKQISSRKSLCSFDLRPISSEPVSLSASPLTLMEATRPSLEIRLQRFLNETTVSCSDEDEIHQNLRIDFYTSSLIARVESSPSASFKLFSKEILQQDNEIGGVPQLGAMFLLNAFCLLLAYEGNVHN
ncbi:hypothetical protein PoB_000029300 [Plakobranchus ocellatus]|uniref:SMB domain-containing protein n=1 Tax=Plakobranchus ocellatus TaxID=259542 RepID=A0AAV3XTG6_9GAST|nr:hypothetical protein PoB_000029300 [Plakobranchus ocellatus]